MTLSRLERAESAQLAGLLATVLPPALLNRIAAQADGVPLFIEELTKAVMEGAVDTTGTANSWRASHAAGFAAGTPRSSTVSEAGGSSWLGNWARVHL